MRGLGKMQKLADARPGSTSGSVVVIVPHAPTRAGGNPGLRWDGVRPSQR